MSGIRHKYRIAREIVDAAIAEVGQSPRGYGGHRYGDHTQDGIVSREFFRRGDRVRHQLTRERGEFRGMIGNRGGALVHFGARGKRVVPVRLLERAG